MRESARAELYLRFTILIKSSEGRMAGPLRNVGTILVYNSVSSDLNRDATYSSLYLLATTFHSIPSEVYLAEQKLLKQL